MKLLGLSALPLAVMACDTAEELAYDISHGGASIHDGRAGHDLAPLSTATLTLFPQDKGDESPACLDGSPFGYYFSPSRSNSTKWTLAIEGGGWCYDEASCYKRSQMALGSSKGWPQTNGCGCYNLKDGVTADDTNPMEPDCNCIYLRYGDGASFSGYRPKPWPVPPSKGGNGSQLLWFRGIKNFDATIDAALKLGLKDATDFVITGGSAGGLSTFLHMDRVANVLKKEAPQAKVHGAPVVGYFLDHDNYQHTANNYTAWMKYIYHMQNLTFGSDGGLTEACSKLFDADHQHYCFMSPHMQSIIQTPFFVFNSKFDAWQLGNELQTKWTDNATRAAVIQYGKDFDTQFAPVVAENHGNGAMITTCICHGCPWNTLTVPGSAKNSYQHYAAWFVGNDTGKDAFHMDMRGPNGDGTIVSKSCSKFP